MVGERGVLRWTVLPTPSKAVSSHSTPKLPRVHPETIVTHEEAFLEDIAEHPDDDAPRLVYADWLDDHGHGAKAEFIRAQCELERLEEYDSRTRELDERVRQLLKENEQQWLGPIGRLAREWRFRKGLLDFIEVEPAVFVENGEKVFQHAPITH